MESKETKRPAEPGRIPLAIGVVLIVLGGLLAIANLSALGTGTLSPAAILMLAAGVIFASLGYLKKR